MKRTLSILWKGIALTLVFVLALVASVLLHLNSAPGLRVVKREVNANLGPLFTATIEVRDLRSVGLFGVRGLSARILAPDGSEIISVVDAAADVNVLGILRSVLLDEGPMVIRLDDIRVPAAQLMLEREASGELKIAKAFALRHPAPPDPPGTPKSRAVHVVMPHIEAGKIHVNGEPTDGLHLDADITDIETNILVTEPGVEIRLVRAKLATKVPKLVEGAPQANAALWIAADLSIPTTGFGPLGFDAQVLGNIGDIPISTVASMRDDVVRALVLVPTTAGERIAAITGAPLQGSMSVRALAYGPLTRLGFVVHAGVGEGAAVAVGYGGVLGRMSLLAHVSGQRVDLHSFGSVHSALNATVDASLSVPEHRLTEPTGTVRVRSVGSTIAEVPLPNTLAYASVTGGQFVLDANVDEPGIPAKIHAKGSAKTPITFSARSQIALDSIERVRLPLRGALALDADGTFDPRSLDLAAKAAVQGHALALPGGLELASVHVEATVSGKASSPQIVTTAKLGDLKVAGISLEHITAGTTVSIGPPLRIEDARVSAQGHGETVTVGASRIELVGDGGVRIHDGTIQGLGERIPVDGDYGKREIRVELAANHVDLARVGRFLSIDDIGGDASLKVNVRGHGEELQGTAQVGLTKGSFDTVRNARAQVEVALEGRDLSVLGKGNLGRAGTFQIDGTELHFSGPPLAPHAFEHIYGQVGLDAEVEFARLPRFIEQLRGKALQGNVRLTGHVSRADGNAMPDATLAAQTYALGFTLPPKDGAKHGLTVAGIDAAADLHLDPASGFAGVATRLHDRYGTIIALDAKANLPFERFTRLAATAPKDLVTELTDSEFNAKIVVAERELQNFPSILGVGGVRGRAGAELNFAGSVRAPRVGLIVTSKDLRDSEGTSRVAANANARLTYDGTLLTLDVDAESGPKGRATVRARAVGKSTDFLVAQDPFQVPWTATARVDTTAFPLSFIPMPDGQKLRGDATGFVALTDFHKNASVETKFEFSNVRIARASFPKITVEASAKDSALTAVARLDQKDGNASFDAKAGLVWGAKLIPSISTDRALEANLTTANLHAAAFLPFAGNALSDLDGRIEAKAHVTAGADGKNVKMDGHINYHDGILGIPAVGQDFRDATASVVLLPNGTIQLTEARARNATGEFKLTASAHFNDLVFDSAEAALLIPKDSPLDMAVQGQSLGEVWGSVKARVAAAKDGSMIAANIAIPSLHAKLSDNGTRSLQALEAPDNINVGRFTRAGLFVAVPRTAADYHGTPDEAPPGKTKVSINVALGDDVEVKRGGVAPFQARFTGKVAVASADTLEVRGQLNLTGGSVDIQGKKFEIERGTVTFSADDPTNPVVIATAGWTAADRSRIYADFVGPVRTGSVTLRSEPAHTKNEIFSLILFGTPDGYSSNGQFNAQQSAATVGGGAIGKGLDKALDDVVGIETQTRIDTTNANNPRPELEVMISRTISLQFAHVLGTPPISQPDVNLGTVKWRFAPRWSLNTTFGDRGKAAVDTLWNYMY